MESAATVAPPATRALKSPKGSEVMKIEIPGLDKRKIKITLVGDTPLVCHAWSAKAKKQILDKQMKKAQGGKAAKDPDKEYQESLYKFPGGGYGFPACAFKKAAVGACSHADGVTKVEARGAFHIHGTNGEELVKINGTPSKREDMVKIGMGIADIRHRGEFRKWSCELEIEYNAQMLTPEQIINLFNIAGFAIGVGEWRPARDGQMGMFHVK